MLDRFKKEVTPLDIQIAKLYEEMHTYSPNDPEYPAMIAYLERLTKLKKESNREKVKSDTIWLIAGNLVGILIIVAYERSHVMITRAKDHVLNTKI